MITIRSEPTDAIFEFEVSGTVTDGDYKDVLIPALEAAISAREQIRALAVFDRNFDNYSLKAMLDDARMGLKHWNGFDRVAVVTGKDWIRNAIKAFAIFMPCPVATFALGEEDAARRWLVEALGSIHQTDLGGGALQVALLGKLDAAVYEAEAENLNAFIRAHEHFRLLVDLRAFDGWQGLAALGQHFRLVRDHRDLPEKIAIVGDRAWQELAQRVGRQFLKAPVQYFPADQFNGAKAWLLAD